MESLDEVISAEVDADTGSLVIQATDSINKTELEARLAEKDYQLSDKSPSEDEGVFQWFNNWFGS